MSFSNSFRLYDIDSRPSATPYVQESGSGDVEMSSLPSADWGPLYEGSTSIGVSQEYHTCFLLYFSLYIEIQVLFIRN